MVYRAERPWIEKFGVMNARTNPPPGYDTSPPWVPPPSFAKLLKQLTDNHLYSSVEKDTEQGVLPKKTMV